jgi:hypothetical protein
VLELEQVGRDVTQNRPGKRVDEQMSVTLGQAGEKGQNTALDERISRQLTASLSCDVCHTQIIETTAGTDMAA